MNAGENEEIFKPFSLYRLQKKKKKKTVNVITSD